MDVRVDIEKNFDRDVKKLPLLEQTMIEQKVNPLIERLKAGPKDKTSLRLSKLKMKNPLVQMGMDSSLYVLKIHKDLRVILTSEADPLFDEHILTLLNVVSVKELESVFNGLAESFSQSFLNGRSQNHG
jgi:hypothetical protein